MPSIAFKSKIRASSEDWSLSLIVQHRLVVGLPSETVQEMKTSLPVLVDVHLDSQLRITISGLLNGDKISPHALQDSCIALHLVDYLRLNANELGIAVSDVHISGDTGLLTFICTGSRPFRPADDDNPSRTVLVGLNLTYVWQPTSSHSDDHVKHPEIVASMNPFSRKQLSLPYLTPVNTIVQKFVTFQLVKRYPLIFGSWAQQLEVEVPFTVSIHKSISRIISRSPHSKFQEICKKLSKLSMKLLSLGSLSAAGKLSVYLGTNRPVNALESFEEHDVSKSMMNFYHRGLRRPLFKGISLSHITEDHHEDFFDDSLGQNNAINPGANSCPGTYPILPQENFEDNLDLEDSSGHSSGGDSASFDPLHWYPTSPLSLSCGAKTLLRDSDPELYMMEPENIAFIATVDCLNDAYANDLDEEDHEMHSMTSNNDHPRHRLSSSFPGWSPDINTSQEKLDRSPVGMPLPEPCLTGTSLVVLDLTSLECCLETPDKKVPENFNDSDFEHWSESDQEDTFEFGTSTLHLEVDCDTGSDSTTPDGHEIIAFECMGSQRLAPLSPHSSISSEEGTSFCTIPMDFGDERGDYCREEERLAKNDHRFLLLDFE